MGGSSSRRLRFTASTARWSTSTAQSDTVSPVASDRYVVSVVQMPSGAVIQTRANADGAPSTKCTGYVKKPTCPWSAPPVCGYARHPRVTSTRTLYPVSWARMRSPRGGRRLVLDWSLRFGIVRLGQDEDAALKALTKMREACRSRPDAAQDAGIDPATIGVHDGGGTEPEQAARARCELGSSCCTLGEPLISSSRRACDP